MSSPANMGGNNSEVSKLSLPDTCVSTQPNQSIPSETELSSISNIEVRHNDSSCASSISVAKEEELELESPLCRTPTWRKSLIVLIMSFVAIATNFSSTALFPATPEIASEFGTTSQVINITNAAVMVAFGLSTFFWGPISQIIGRRKAYLSAVLVLALCSAGTSVSPNLASLVTFRLLAGFEGTYFLVAGQTIISDLYVPTKRGTAMGFFMAGTVIGPAVGPCLGGIIITFISWRVIFWLQTGMVALGFVLGYLFVPADIVEPLQDAEEKASSAFDMHSFANFNPMHSLRLMIYPNVLLIDISTGLLSWTQFTLLISPRYVINPRFQLSNSIASGLFYIAPGFGFLTGALIGGRLADRAVRKWMVKRGYRLPQDRLNSSFPFLFAMLPISWVVFGLCSQIQSGGLAMVIISTLGTSIGLMGAFNSLNTYCAEVMPLKRTEVICSKYLVQYSFSAIVNATFLPLLEAVGIAAVCTIGAVFAVIAGVLCLVVAKQGRTMQDWVDEWKAAKVEQKSGGGS